MKKHSHVIPTPLTGSVEHGFMEHRLFTVRHLHLENWVTKLGDFSGPTCKLLYLNGNGWNHNLTRK